MARNVSLRLDEELVEDLDEEAAERGVSRSEYMRTIIEDRHEVERLQERLQDREDRISDLEDQLARQTSIEEKIDTLAARIDDEDTDEDRPTPPFIVRWVQWWRRRGEE